MRRLFVVVALASCAPRTNAPAWPRDRPVAADGGESLAPHVRKQVSAVAIERAEDTKPVVVRPTAPPVVTVTPARETPVVAPPPQIQPTETTITTEDIVIDIDD